MTLAFIALKPPRRFVARITFQSVRILRVVSCPIVRNILYDRGVKGKEVILLIMSVCLVGLQLDDSEWREQVSIILSSVNYLREYFIL